MNIEKVIFVKVYITESSHLLQEIVNYLRDEAKIRGLSVIRATSGFGDTGEHQCSLVDLSLDLPLIIEFFDIQKKITPAIEHLSTLIKTGHIVFWDAKVNA